MVQMEKPVSIGWLLFSMFNMDVEVLKISIPNLYENTPFDNFNVTHTGTKNHQVTINFMENEENTLINTENM